MKDSEVRIEMEHRNSVLIVEDDMNINGLLKEALERRIHMYTGVFGNRSENAFAGKRDSVILLDLMLPGIPGEEVVFPLQKDSY